MKVAVVSEHASPLAALGGVDAGGQNVHVAALATELAARRLDVEVFTRRDDPNLPTRVRVPQGYTVVHVDAGPARSVPKDDLLPHMGEFSDRLALEWTTAPPDIVHSHFWMSGMASLAAARPLGIPVVHTFHALGVVKQRHQGRRDTSPASRLAEEGRLASSVDHIIATCSDEVFELVRLGADAKRVTIVPCGVDTELFRPEGPAEARGDRGHRLLTIGRLVERKGVDDVIAALAHLPKAELVVVGGPARDRLSKDPEARRLAQAAHASEVSERVQFRGRVDHGELPAIIRSADVVVCAPWYEPFGIVPLEAMACAVPVVVSAVGGLIDSVVDGVTGLQVPPHDPIQLARAIESLLDDPDRRGALGRQGAARVLNRYRWSQVAATTADVYRRVAGGQVLRANPAARR